MQVSDQTGAVDRPREAHGRVPPDHRQEKTPGVSRLAPSSPAHDRVKKTKKNAEKEAPPAAATEKQAKE